MNKMTSRRYWLVVACAATFTILLYSSDINQETYQTLMQSIVGAYLLSSYAEKKLLSK